MCRGVRGEALLDEGFAVFGGAFVCCQSAIYHAGVAYLIPVVLGTEEPRLRVVLGGAKALLVYGRPDDAARVARKSVMEPVVTYGQGHGHLAHIEEVRRIPVAEGAYGEHLLLGAGGVARVVGGEVCIRQVEDAFERLA